MVRSASLLSLLLLFNPLKLPLLFLLFLRLLLKIAASVLLILFEEENVVNIFVVVLVVNTTHYYGDFLGEIFVISLKVILREIL